MEQVQESVEIPAPPDRVWKAVGDPASLEKWHPLVTTSSLEGDVRLCTLEGGDEVIEERILDYSDEERVYVYEIDKRSLPLQGFAVRSYTARIRVEEEAGGSRVYWESEFEPVDPAAGPELAAASHSFYRTGLEHLRGLVEAG